MNCIVSLCDQPAKGRGWCNKHYARFLRLGTVELSIKPKVSCAVEDCTAPSYCRDLCTRHYQRQNRKGTVVDAPVVSAGDRLRANAEFNPEGCWIWQGKPGKHGYGVISIGNQGRYAHRLSYETFVRPIPDGLSIDHLCRVRMCINPSHLEPVTLAENTRREFLARSAS